MQDKKKRKASSSSSSSSSDSSSDSSSSSSDSSRERDSKKKSKKTKKDSKDSKSKPSGGGARKADEKKESGKVNFQRQNIFSLSTMVCFRLLRVNPPPLARKLPPRRLPRKGLHRPRNARPGIKQRIIQIHLCLSCESKKLSKANHPPSSPKARSKSGDRKGGARSKSGERRRSRSGGRKRSPTPQVRTIFPIFDVFFYVLFFFKK